ncbi:MAG: MarR family transcriptional regulator [Firmicutes bacterium]|nr:MarR family transcriptional regulator [Bacillota bacterium]
MSSDGDRYLAHRVIIEIASTYDLMEDVFNRHLARFGISQVKYKAMMQLLYAGDDGLPLSELGEKMAVSRANITGLVDRLERDGLVSRETDSRDRRVVRARVTARAKELLQFITPIHGEFTGSLLSVLDSKEKETLIELLKKVQSSLERH